MVTEPVTSRSSYGSSFVWRNVVTELLQLRVEKDSRRQQRRIPGRRVRAVKRNFYVDDCLKSVESAKNAVEFMHQLTSILSKGGFRLTKWLSNSSEVLNCIPRVERAPS